MIHSLLGIIGPTCSGKSTITGIIQQLVPVNVVSFGKYLYNYSVERSLPTDKPSLQNLGNSFIQNDPEGFLKKVLDFGMDGQKIVLIEGIRHKSILASLIKMSTHSYLIFVDAEIRIRYLRYCERENYLPETFPFANFESMESHVVESEVNLLKAGCDTIIQNDNMDLSSLTASISVLLSEKTNFLKIQ